MLCYGRIKKDSNGLVPFGKERLPFVSCVDLVLTRSWISWLEFTGVPGIPSALHFSFTAKLNHEWLDLLANRVVDEASIVSQSGLYHYLKGCGMIMEGDIAKLFYLIF